MAGDIDSNGHVRLSLGLYVLGALDDDALLRVEEHLAQCAQCRAESAEYGGVPVALAMLSPQEVDGLIREFGVPDGTPGPTATEQPRDPATAPPKRGRGPGGGRPPGRARTSGRRRWRPAQMRLALAGCLVALVIGAAAGLWVNIRTGPTPIDTTLTGEATDSSTGATVTVTVETHAGRSTVRATVTGLRPAIPYQLFAVTVDGRTLMVHQWLGTDKPQTVAGDIPATAAQIAHFTVARQDGEVVVTVRFTGASTSTGGPTSRPTAAAPSS